MSSDYHTPIPSPNAPGNAATVNTPLGQLDSAIGNILLGTYNFSNLNFTSAPTYPIVSGDLFVDNIFIKVEAETGTLDEINSISTTSTDIVFLKAAAGHTIVLTNTLLANTSSNIEITFTENDVICLVLENSQWSILNLSPVINIPRNLACIGFELDTFNSTNTISIQPGQCVSDDGRSIIESANTIGIDLDTTGVGGLDTGATAANTPYYVWLVKGTSGVNAIASLSDTSPTLPSGYTQFKRRIFGFVTDASGDIFSGYMPTGQGNNRRYYFTEVTKAAPFQILNEVNVGLTGSRTTVDVDDLVPENVRVIIALIEILTPGGTSNVFWSATGARDTFILSVANTGQISSTVYDLEISTTNQTAQIFADASVDEDLSLYVLGYVDSNLATA